MIIMDYIYDGTFYGLLTCVYEHYYSRKASGIYEEKNYQYSIINEFKIIDTNDEKAVRVYNSLKENVSKKALEYIYYSWLSNEVDKGCNILNFIEYGFSVKKDVTRHFEHEAVYPICVIYRKVAQEVHSFLGLLRFSDIDGVLVAVYKPDHDITELLAPHFADRLGCERFIIYDERRKKGAVSSMGEWIMSQMEELEVKAGTVESEIRRYWKEYFESVAIKERKNREIQYQKVPVRYRKNIVEFK